MRSIMKESFKIEKPKKVNIDSSKGMLYNLNKLIKFIEKNHGVKPTKGNVIKLLSILYNEEVEELNESNVVHFRRYYGEQPTYDKVMSYMAEDVGYFTKKEDVNFGVYVIRRDNKTGDTEDNTYLVINYDDTFTSSRNGKNFSRRNERYKYQIINVKSVMALGLIYNSMEKVWKLNRDKIYNQIKEYFDSNPQQGSKTYAKYTLNNFDTVYRGIYTNYLLSSDTFSAKKRVLYENTVVQSPIFELIYNHLEYAYSQHLNYVQMVKYVKDRESDYATAFKTKKNITKKIQEEMEESPFLKYYKYVELDNDTDINKYLKVFEEYEKVTNKIVKIPKNTELRFRKLGNHRAIGVYFPHMNCISIDLRDVSAFIHEYAHAVDFNMGRNEPMSLQEDFFRIIRHYRENYSKLSGGDDYYHRKRDYYNSPTEIFARGFELAYRLKGYDTFLVAPKDKMSEIPYKAFKGIESEVEDYFSKYIN